MELDRLAWGACGGDSIAVDVYLEKVELPVCASCGSVVIIYAEDEGDLSTPMDFKASPLRLVGRPPRLGPPQLKASERLNLFYDGYHR